MLERVLCPTLVGRDEQLFVLEDALFAAHRGESRFVALSGEAGMGKTRLATELAKQAQRLGWEVLWGACSEAELPLPYLPIVAGLGAARGRARGGAARARPAVPAARRRRRGRSRRRPGAGEAPSLRGRRRAARHPGR